MAALMVVAQSFLVPSIPFLPVAQPDFLKEAGSSFSANHHEWESYNCCLRKPFPSGGDPLRTLREVEQVQKQQEDGAGPATEHTEPLPLCSQLGSSQC